MIEITIRYGLTKKVENVEVPEGTTVRDILRNPTFKTVLGFPEGVSAIVDGNTLDVDDILSDGDVVVLEKQAAAKAA